MSSFRLSQRAIESLTSIFAWTITRFGVAHAADYRDALIRRCQALADGHPPHGRPCDILLKGHNSAKDLHYYREGGHFILYQKAAGSMVIVDFVHERRDLPRIIERISQTDS